MKVLKFVLVFFMITLLGACHSGSESQKEASTNSEAKKETATYSWKAANVLSSGGAWDQGLLEFARLLKEKSNGTITLSVYSGGQLGGERDSIEGLQMGAVDFVICSSATLSNFSDSNNIWDLPFLFNSTTAARAVMDSEIGQNRLDALSSAGIKGLAYWENGMYVIGAKKPIKTPEDMKGLKVRAIESNMQADLFSAFGATSVVIPWGDVYTSLQQGVCDAQGSTTGPNMYSAKQHEVAQYITEAGQIYSPAPLLMSKKLWNSLSAENQKIVLDAANEAKLFERHAVDTLTEKSKQLMIEDGCEFITIDKNEWAGKLTSLYDNYVGKNGIEPEMVKQIKTISATYN